MAFREDMIANPDKFKKLLNMVSGTFEDLSEKEVEEIRDSEAKLEELEES